MTGIVLGYFLRNDLRWRLVGFMMRNMMIFSKKHGWIWRELIPVRGS
jgi:hypothetical protein